MKKLLFTIVSSIMITSSAFSSDLVKLDPNKIVKVNLFDARSLNFKSQVKGFGLHKNKLDFLELKSGEIVDRTDIDSYQFYHSNSLMMARLGINGGG